MGLHTDVFSLSKIAGIGISVAGMAAWQGLKKPQVGAPLLGLGMVITLVGGGVEVEHKAEAILEKEKNWEKEQKAAHVTK